MRHDDDPTEPLTALESTSRPPAGHDHRAQPSTADTSDGQGATHDHHHAHGRPHAASRTVRRLLTWLLAPLALAALSGAMLLYPWGEASVQGRFKTGTTVHGTVTAASVGACRQPGEVRVGPPDPAAARCLTLRVRMTDGPAAGSTIHERMPIEPGVPRFSVGDDLVLSYSSTIGPPTSATAYRIVDFQRGLPLLALAAILAIVVVGFARWQGLKALISLGLSFAVLAVFILPAILAGRDPLLVATVGAGLIMFAALYLTHGFSARTSVAVLGTLSSLGLIVGLAAAATAITHLTGIDPETANLITALGHDIDTRGLLLAGILIGALGVLDDVTVTQANAVWELGHANPTWGWQHLYASAMRIGRPHATSAVNTLFMAYAGAALPLMLYTAISGVDLGVLLSSKVIAQEIVRTIAGSLGLIASIPATTLIAALIVGNRPHGGNNTNARPRTSAHHRRHTDHAPRQPRHQRADGSRQRRTSV